MLNNLGAKRILDIRHASRNVLACSDAIVTRFRSSGFGWHRKTACLFRLLTAAVLFATLILIDAIHPALATCVANSSGREATQIELTHIAQTAVKDNGIALRRSGVTTVPDEWVVPSEKTQSLRGVIRNPPPDIKEVYVLIRHQGEGTWRLQRLAYLGALAIGSNQRPEEYYSWSGEVSFEGFDVSKQIEQGAQGAHFELRILATCERLPEGPIDPQNILEFAAARSEVYFFFVKPEITVEITQINGEQLSKDKSIYGTITRQTLISLNITQMPSGASAGIIVRPTIPESGGRRWVMGDRLTKTGDMVAYIGAEEFENVEEFEIVAFAAYTQHDRECFGTGRPLNADDWVRCKPLLLAESTPVKAIRWMDSFAIKTIDGIRIDVPQKRDNIRWRPQRRQVPTSITGDVSEICGNLSRPLTKDKERVWLLVIPIPCDHDPWLAGYTNNADRTGRWCVLGPNITFTTESSSRSFALLAVISEDSPLAQNSEDSPLAQKNNGQNRMSNCSSLWSLPLDRSNLIRVRVQ